MLIQFDFLPVSTNTLYRQFRGRTIVSKKGREFKNLVSFLVKGMDSSHLRNNFSETRGLAVKIEFVSNKFFTKRGTIRKRYLDLDNLLKVILDVVFKEIGLDDSMITKLEISKSDGYYDSTRIFIKLNDN